MSKTIAILNFKGGVAKTTTTLNTGVALWMMGQKVLLVDADAQCNLTRHLGFDQEKDDATLFNWMQDNTIDPPVYTKYDGLHYIPAGRNLLDIESQLLNKRNREHVLRERLEVIKDYFDYIIVDCSPHEGVLNDNVMTASDGVIIPIECSTYAIDGLVDITKAIQETQQYSNKNLELLGLLITRYVKSLRISREVKRSLEDNYGEKLFRIHITENVKVKESPMECRSIFEYEPVCQAAEDYFRFAEDLIGRKHDPKWTRLLKKLK